MENCNCCSVKAKGSDPACLGCNPHIVIRPVLSRSYYQVGRAVRIHHELTTCYGVISACDYRTLTILMVKTGGVLEYKTYSYDDLADFNGVIVEVLE